MTRGFDLLVRLPMDFHESALREYLDPTGKRSAVKVARCVWKGGKAVRPYLSLLTAKIHHKPIEPLHRPIEGMTAEAKAGVRNA